MTALLTVEPPDPDSYKIILRVGSKIPPDLIGRAMLEMERSLRQAGCPALVEKETKADDSKLRLKMTPAERSKL